MPLRAKFGGHRCTAFVRCPGRTTLEYLNPFQSNLCPHRSQNFMYSRSRDIEQRGQIGNVMPSFKSMTSATGIGNWNAESNNRIWIGENLVAKVKIFIGRGEVLCIVIENSQLELLRFQTPLSIRPEKHMGLHRNRQGIRPW